MFSRMNLTLVHNVASIYFLAFQHCNQLKRFIAFMLKHQMLIL